MSGHLNRYINSTDLVGIWCISQTSPATNFQHTSLRILGKLSSFPFIDILSLIDSVFKMLNDQSFHNQSHPLSNPTGELQDSVVSNPNTGYFEVETIYDELHYLVILPELSDGYQPIAQDQIDPV